MKSVTWKRKMPKDSPAAGKKAASAFCLLAFAALVGRLGNGGLAADFVEQDSWHLIRAEAVSEGVAVETAGENLVLHSGVRVTADSEENREFSAAKVRDGIRDDKALRWSSDNDWEDNEHWLEICFPQEVTVGLVRIYWERRNARAYTLEYSQDGKKWTAAAKFEEQPVEEKQDIYLTEPVTARYLRLHVTDVVKDEADLSLYYQNVSVLEFEVYEGIEDSFLIEKPKIPEGSSRRLALSGEALAGGTAEKAADVPEGYSLEFAGADYEMLVDVAGRIADTVADTRAELGFALVRDGVRRELPGMEVEIPAAAQKRNTGIPAAQEKERPGETAQDGANENLPEGFAAMEWSPGFGTYGLTAKTRVVISGQQKNELAAAARLFAEELSAYLGRTVEFFCAESSGAGAEKNDIFLFLLENETDGTTRMTGLGEEGYEICLGTKSGGDAGTCTQIGAETLQGLRWGCVSFLSLLEKTGGELPEGKLRDYPRYSVRGFGIDVGRRPVSMELLYRIVREMSKQKMNTLQVHLNDNQIISQSDHGGTVEGARSLYAGFRLESELKNEKGEGITSSDLYYTKEEFARFIADAAVYGVEIVPEIDTPAHSLSITKAFPKLGLSRNPESADQLDLSKPEAVELGKALWSEYLTGSAGTQRTEGKSDAVGAADSGDNSSAEQAVFAGCSALHIGMDEYFGDEKEYISYLEEISNHVGTLAPDKEIRIWGSLSKIRADHSGVSKNIQMHIWDTGWADPQDMYDEGFPVINSLSSSLYIIPGGGYDWLEQDFLAEKWQPNVFETQERIWELPAYSPKMLGAVYMMWNDWSQLNGESITEDDLFARFAKPLPVIAQKLWGT